MRIVGKAVLAAALAAPCAVADEAARSVAGPPPLRLQAEDVLGYVAVPDLETLLAHVEATSRAAGFALPPGAARAGLAQKLGLASLEGLAAKPILLVVLKPAAALSPPRPVLFLPVKDGARFEAALGRLGWKTRLAGGLLVGSSTAEGLVAATPLEAEYRRIAADAAITHDLRVFLQMSRLMEAYGPLLQLGMDAAAAPKASPDSAQPGAAPSAAAARTAKVQVKAFFSVLRQLDDVQWDMDLLPEGLASDTVVTARPATGLDALARMPPAGRNRAAALLSGAGVMTATYQMDPARLAAFLGGIVKDGAADAESASLFTPGVAALVDQMGAAYGGHAAYRVAGKAQGLAVETVIEVTDEARALALVEKTLELFSPQGAWAPLLEESRVSLALQKAARRHKGVTVHRLKVKADPKGPLAARDAAQAPFLRDTELAITRGFYLSAQDPAGLDVLIDRALAGAAPEGLALSSARVFGEGRHAYVDYDLIGLMKAVSAMTPPEKGAPDPFADLPAAADPFLTAMTFGDGRIRWQSRIPVRPFVLMAETIKKAAPSPAPSPAAPQP